MFKIDLQLFGGRGARNNGRTSNVQRKNNKTDLSKNEEKIKGMYEFQTLDDFPKMVMNDRQIGKKGGEHAQEMGFDIKTPEGRKAYRDEANRIRREAEEVRIINWRGKGKILCYAFKDSNKALLTKLDGEFITLFVDKGNLRIKDGVVLWKKQG